MKNNGSKEPEFETNETRDYFITTIFMHDGFEIVSLVLAILAQWRYKYVTLPLPKEIYKHVHDNYKPFLNNINQIKHYNELLNEVQESKKKNNDFRVELIKWSMIFFFLGIIAFIISAIVAINIIIFK